MAWLWIAIAGAFEIAWALMLVYSAGMTRLLPTLAMLVCMGASLGAMSLALRALPMGTAYAVWTGIGAAGTAIAGILLFGEPASLARLVSIGLIIAGIAGLKLVG
jgi:quaternary ammonium compound-resistance protein SugE